MKEIWNEKIGCGFVTHRWFDYGTIPEAVFEHTEYVTAQSIAYYDKTTGTLRIDLSVGGSESDWTESVHRTVLDTFPTREQALRHIIQIADDWMEHVRKCMPPSDTRTNAQVKADYEASQATPRDNALLASGDGADA